MTEGPFVKLYEVRRVEGSWMGTIRFLHRRKSVHMVTSTDGFTVHKALISVGYDSQFEVTLTNSIAKYIAGLIVKSVNPSNIRVSVP